MAFGCIGGWWRTASRNVVVDSSSIEVNRRARRAKTDRLDAGKLLQLLLRWAAGEPRVWSVVHVPTPEAEAARQLTREIATVRADRTQVRNRMLGLLATQGIRCTLTRRFSRAARPTLQTGDGRPLPAAWRDRLAREWAHLQAIERGWRSSSTVRDAAIATAEDRVAAGGAAAVSAARRRRDQCGDLQCRVVRDADALRMGGSSAR